MGGAVEYPVVAIVDASGVSMSLGGVSGEREEIASGQGGVSTKFLSKNHSNNQSKLGKINTKSLQKAKHKLYERKEIEVLTNKILKEISENSEMNIGDLIRITNKRVERRLKETEGLLWHYRLNHASLSEM